MAESSCTSQTGIECLNNVSTWVDLSDAPTSVVQITQAFSAKAASNARGVVLENSWLSLLLLLAFTITYFQISSFYERRKIGRLGSFAPPIPSRLPFAIDAVYSHVRHTLINRDLKFWSWIFAQSPWKSSATLEITAGRQRYIFTADPENIKAVLATQFHDFGKGQNFYSRWKEFLGSGIFTMDGDAWHANRQLLRPQFTKERIMDLDTFEIHVHKLISKLPKDREVFDISQLFYRFTMDVATEYLVGQSVGYLDNPKAAVAAAYTEVGRQQILIQNMGPFAPLVPRYKLRRSLKIIEEFIEPFITRVSKEDLGDLEHDHSFSHALLARGINDRKVLRDQFMNILLAGRDTTAVTLSFTFYELSRHPEALAELRREILQHVGKHRKPTYQDMKDMPYLRYVLNEVLRLYPVLPFNIRWSLKDTTLPTGGGPDGRQPIGIAKGTAIAYSPMYLHRREDLYPADMTHPDEFDPSRWKSWTPQSWQYIPFNGGPRICLGQQFALTEISYTVIRILQQYDVLECHARGDGPIYKARIIISPVNGIPISMKRAEDER